MCTTHRIIERPLDAGAEAKGNPFGELAALADEMHAKCEELMGRNIGAGAAGLLVDAWADRIDRALGIEPMPKAETTRSHGDTEGAYFTPDAVLQNPPLAEETSRKVREVREAEPPSFADVADFARDSAAPITRAEAIQILSCGLKCADRRTRSAHFMAIHALAKRMAEQKRHEMRKEGGSHD